MEQVKEQLSRLVKKDNIYLLKSGNQAIKTALEITNRKTTLIQDQGGWLTYLQFPKNLQKIKTSQGIISNEELIKYANENNQLLINSLQGYFSLQPMKEIEKLCKEKNCLIINDISGSIGTEEAIYGDLILGSFGKWKPINLEYGGFIASNKPLKIKEEFEESKLEELNKKLTNLPKRLKQLKDLNNKTKSDLKNLDILNKDSYSLVTIIRYKNSKEKEEIIDYCKKNKYAYTECPRYIRVNEKAISIELKRI